MEKLHSQLPQPLKRCSPSRHGDLVTQIKNGNSPLLSNRSPARRVATSSPNNIRSSPRDVTAVATLTAKQPEAKARSPEVPGRSRDTATTPTRRPKYSPAAANGNMSPTARGKILSRAAEAAVVSETKQSPAKSLAAKQPLRIKTAQVRTLSPSVESMSNQPYAGRDDEEPLWAQNSQARSSGTKKSFSPKYERRGCFKKAEQLDSVEDEAKNDAGGGGGSPIYHELDPPGTCRFPVQHTYQSIVEISDELESLRMASAKPEAGGGEDAVAGHQLARARSAQELTQKSPTGSKLSLFSRFRFAASKKSSAAKTSGKAELPRPLCAPEVSGQRSLQDVDLITRSRDEVGAAESSHDRQPSFSTFAHRATATAASRDADGYSSVYVPQNFADVSVARIPPRTSSLNPPDSHRPPAPPEPLYKQKFLKIASVHTLQNASVDEERAPCLTSSNSVGDLLLATNVAHQSPRRVTSYDDHAVATGSRKMAARVRKQADARAQTARCGGLSPGRGAASFSSPSCGIRMAEMRGAVRRCTTSPTRSPSSSTPLPSPARLSVFQFNVPPAGVMLSPPVHRAYRHVSSQTVTSVRPPGASCVLSVTAVHSPTAGPPGQMQTIEEEEDSTNDELKSVPPSSAATTVARQPSVDETPTNGAPVVRARVSDDTGRKLAEDDSGTDGVQRTSTEGTSAVSRTSKLRRPSPTLSTAKPLCTHGPGSSPVPEHQPSRIVPPSANGRRRTESSSVSPPSTPRSVDSQARSGSARGELVRRQYTRGQQQQQRKQVAPPAEGDAAQIVDALSVTGVLRKPCLRRLPAAPHTDGSGSSNASSGSSLSLLSTGSDAPAAGLRGSPAPESADALPPSRTSSAAAVGDAAIQPRHSASSKLNELTVVPAADHVNY